MQHDNPFADEVRMNPYDDTPRLIFADYLDDYGNPLGQFIRTQVSLHQLPQSDPTRTKLELQERELIDAYGESWLAPLRALGAEGVTVSCFQRGLIERIKISARNFLANGALACAQSPALHTIQITHLEEALSDFTNAELPQQIRGLDLSSSGIGSLKGERHRWSQFRCLDQLTELGLQFTKVSDEEIVEFCQRDLSQLSRLNLGVNLISSRAAIALANCTSIVGLTHLLMPLNKVSPEGAQAIANSPYFGALVELDLSSNNIATAGVRAIAASVTLQSLERLNLRANVITDPTLLQIESYASLPKLTTLDTRNWRR